VAENKKNGLFTARDILGAVECFQFTGEFINKGRSFLPLVCTVSTAVKSGHWLICGARLELEKVSAAIRASFARARFFHRIGVFPRSISAHNIAKLFQTRKLLVCQRIPEIIKSKRCFRNSLKLDISAFACWEKSSCDIFVSRTQAHHHVIDARLYRNRTFDKLLT